MWSGGENRRKEEKTGTKIGGEGRDKERKWKKVRRERTLRTGRMVSNNRK